MRFIKKAIVVYAEQYTEGHTPDGVHRRFRDGEWTAYVRTINNVSVLCGFGDWILTEQDGINHYPVKNEIFMATYDPA